MEDNKKILKPELVLVYWPDNGNYKQYWGNDSNSTKLANLDATVSSRLAPSGGRIPA